MTLHEDGPVAQMAVVSDTLFSTLIVAGIGLAASTVGFAIAWIRARERAIRAEQRSTPRIAEGDARFERLEQALETMTLDVERMTEGQRFISRLLAERSTQDRDKPARPAREVTPH